MAKNLSLGAILVLVLFVGLIATIMTFSITGNVTSRGIPKKCTENDSGRDFSNKGNTETLFQKVTDRCVNNKYNLFEAWCSTNNIILRETVRCSDLHFGDVCINGACTPFPEDNTKEEIRIADKNYEISLKGIGFTSATIVAMNKDTGECESKKIFKGTRKTFSDVGLKISLSEVGQYGRMSYDFAAVLNVYNMNSHYSEETIVLSIKDYHGSSSGGFQGCPD